MIKKKFSIFIPRKFIPYERIEYRLLHETNSEKVIGDTMGMYCRTHGLDPDTVWIKDNNNPEDDLK